MKFAMICVDRYLGVFEAFTDAGWTPVKLFTVPVDNQFDSCKSSIAHATRLGAEVQFERVTARSLADLADRGCEALIVASYPWRIPLWEPYLTYAVNFHCSPLPEGRGPYPVHRALLEGRKTWAVTCHKISPAFDQGDILATEHFPLSDTECHETLTLKIKAASNKLAAELAPGFEEVWTKAVPQEEGSYWPLLALEDRIIDFNRPVKAVLRHVRAFGTCYSLAVAGAHWIAVARAAGEERPHCLEPGRIAGIHGGTIIVAASDGFVALLDTQLADVHVGQTMSRRGIFCDRQGLLSAAPVYAQAVHSIRGAA